MEAEVLKIRAATKLRTLIRFAGLAAVLVGAYHLFVPLVSPAAPTFAPWRQFGFIAIEGLRGLYLGDVLLAAGGAVVVWFV
jgi:hypothetical protein